LTGCHCKNELLFLLPRKDSALYKGSNQWRTTTAVGFEVTPTTSHCPSPWHLAAMFCALLALAHAQTASTGSLIGFVVDPAGSVVPGVILHLIEQASGESHLAVSDNEGRFCFPFLRPGSYQLQISKSQFAPLSISEMVISVMRLCMLRRDSMDQGTHMLMSKKRGNPDWCRPGPFWHTGCEPIII
jgi:carboxypeptidase family protein